jgi:hypothetical protein
MLISISRPKPSPSKTVDDWRQDAAARLESLLQTMNTKDFAETEVVQLRTLKESLPPDNLNSGLAANYLNKAQRFLHSHEVGAAMYELRLLLGWLQCC